MADETKRQKGLEAIMAAARKEATSLAERESVIREFHGSVYLLASEVARLRKVILNRANDHIWDPLE